MSTWHQRAGLLSLVVALSLATQTPAHAQISPYGLNPLAPAPFAGGGVGGPFLGRGGMGVGGMGYGGIGGGLNPYSPGGIASMAAYNNPYSPYGAAGAAGVSAYYPYYGQSGGIYGEAGGALFGASFVIKAYGEALTAQEQARITRQQYYQQKLETMRKKFDLDMYIKAHTPTFAEEQKQIAEQTLRRIQNNSTPGEISSAKAINILLDDARRFPGKKVTQEPISLTGDLLKHLNVTKGSQGLGVLRNDGKVNWPVAIVGLVPAQELKDMSVNAEALVRGAANGKLDVNVLKDLRRGVEATREQLLKKVNDLPGLQYMEARRFLNDFDDALQAVERGEVVTQSNFDRFIGTGKSVQEVVDYLTANGLRIAPATLGDDAAYRALYSALVAYDVALNSQFGVTETRETKE